MTRGHSLNVAVRKYFSIKTFIFAIVLFMGLLIFAYIEMNKDGQQRYGLDFKLSYKVSKVTR